MFLRSVGLGAALALAANAFLIPPTTDLIDVEEIQHGHPAINPESETVRLACPGCPYPVKNEQGIGRAWSLDVPNFLELNLKIHHEDGDALYLDGVPIFPPRFGQLPPPITVSQVAAEGSDIGVTPAKHTGFLLTGYSIKFDPATTVSEDGLELLPITINIVSVERQSVSPPELTVFLLKDVSGNLHIASALAKEPQRNPAVSKLESCRHWPALCRLKSSCATKLQQMKTSFRKHCHMGRPHRGHGNGGIIPPHMHKNGRPHHHNHKHAHPFFHIFIHTIALPILLGMAVGALTYAVGMFLGCAGAMIWSALRGSPREGYVSLSEDEEQVSAKEAEASVDAELPADAPPVYQELPEKE